MTTFAQPIHLDAHRAAGLTRAACCIIACTALAIGPLCGCRPEPAASSRYFAFDAAKPDVLGADDDPRVRAQVAATDALFDGTFRLMGASAPEQVRRGGRVRLRTLWRLERDAPAEGFPKLQVFVHGQVPGAELNQLQADHPLAPGTVPLAELRAGDLVVDEVSLIVPTTFPADQLELHIGLYQGNHRWPIDETQGEAANDRLRVAVVRVPDGPPVLPTARALRRRSPIQLDGVLDEPDWQRAMRLGPFVAHDGRRQLSQATHARILWDEQHLYVAFECDDDDVHTPYSRRDDPLYESEAVEIFIDADGDLDEYVELQAAANDTHFDAAFRGGRRKNFETGYDVAYDTHARIDGTLNRPDDADRGWVSEWRIPIAELRDVPRAPQAGDRWRINLFRLERRRRGGRVIATEASAWSSPLSGDFHHLARFGTLEFADR